MPSLIKCGPFLGVQAKADPGYVEPGMGVTASNVDVTFRYGAFNSAQGRTILGSISLPPGYSLQCVAPLVSFSGDTTITSRRIYVFSAVNGSLSIQGWYDPARNSTTTLSSASPFTQAQQFGSALWTNGGDKIYYKSNGQLDSDIWQISVPYQYSYNVSGTYLVTAGSAPVDTYTYAITLRKAEFWNVTGTAPNLVISPDVDSLQESSPIFSTSVTTTTGQQPGFTVPTSLGLQQLVQGVTIGSDTYYGCLHRSRTGNPSYTFVDYLANIPIVNDHNGQASIIDTYADATIQNNAYLITHRDPPPMLGQTYSGAIQNNSNAVAQNQQQQQVAFTYKNPAFIAKHKGRMFCFTMYPVEAVGTTPATTPATISLQSQLWFSEAGQPWSYDSVNGALVVGPEDAPGNYSVDAGVATKPIWQPGLIEDTPMGMASTGTYLVMFKSSSMWILLGDSPSEFLQGVRCIANIGCLSTNSIAAAEGGVFWQAPQGVYFFSGGQPSYIGEDVQGIIEGLSWSDRQKAVGSYQDRTFFLSFPNITLAYYTPTQKWYTLPYGASYAVWSSYNQNQLIFVNGNQLQLVEGSAATDLGQPIVSTWVSQLSDFGTPGVLSSLKHLTVTAPIQPGTVTVRVDLDVNAGISNWFSATWDLSKGNGAHVVSLPPKMSGYDAQLTITTTTSPTATTPISLRSVELLGEPIKHSMIPIAHDPSLINQFLNGVNTTNG